MIAFKKLCKGWIKKEAFTLTKFVKTKWRINAMNILQNLNEIKNIFSQNKDVADFDSV